MVRLRRVIQILLGLLIGGYILTNLLLSVPRIQHTLSRLVSKELTDLLGTKVTIKNVELKLFNRIVMDDLYLEDLSHHRLLVVKRAAVRYDFLPLLHGAVRINAVQLLTPRVFLRKDSIDGTMNYDFLTQLFSTDKPNPDNRINLRINSLLIRRGELNYSVFSDATSLPKIKLSGLTTKLSVKTITPDSINIKVKDLNFTSHLGFELKRLSFHLLANNHHAAINDLRIDLPNSKLMGDEVAVDYKETPLFGGDIVPSMVALNIKQGSHVSLADLKEYVPTLAHFPQRINLEMQMKGNLKELKVKQFSAYTPGQLNIACEGTLANLDSIPILAVDASFTRGLISHKQLINIANQFEMLPSERDLLSNLGDINLFGDISGPIRAFKASIGLESQVGALKGKLDLKEYSSRHNLLKGSFKADGFDIAKVLNDSTFGRASMDLQFSRIFNRGKMPKYMVQGAISEFEYKDYNYQNISLDAQYVPKEVINGEIWIDDPKGTLWLGGNLTFGAIENRIRLDAALDRVKLGELNLVKDKQTVFTASAHCFFQGKTLDDMHGELTLSKLDFKNHDRTYHTDSLRLKAKVGEDLAHELSIDSDVFSLNMAGHYRYEQLIPTVEDILYYHAPNLRLLNLDWKRRQSLQRHQLQFKYNRQLWRPENGIDCTLDLTWHDQHIFSDLFGLPIEMMSESNVHVSLNENRKELKVVGYVPRMRYANRLMESVSVDINSDREKLDTQVRFNSRRPKSTISVALDNTLHQDSLNTSLYWGNSEGKTFSGKVSLATVFHDKGESLEAQIAVKKSKLIISDSIWTMPATNMYWTKNRIVVDSLQLKHMNQFVAITGVASDKEMDQLKIELNDINLGYVFEMTNLKRSIDFKGDATGYVYAKQILKRPLLDTKIQVKNFSYNDALMGNLNLNGAWDYKEQGIAIDAVCKSDSANTLINGYIYPSKPKSGLDLHFHADHTNGDFMNLYLRSIFSDTNVIADGNIRLFGSFDKLDLEGDMLINGATTVNLLQTRYAINDSIHLRPGKIQFNKIKITDNEGHTGSINGVLNHTHLSNMLFNFRFESNNLLINDTDANTDLPFYGHIYASGYATLWGQNGVLHANASLKTNKGSTFCYVLSEKEDSYNTNFITFHDKTPKVNDIDSTIILDPVSVLGKKKKKLNNKTTDDDLFVNIQVEATPDIEVKLIIDPVAGDNIKGSGRGNIRFDYYNHGKTNLYGKYDIYRGLYQFSLQEVIRKDFNITRGSSISFNGDPYQATMNVNAKYRVNAASLNDLGSDVAALVESPNVRVDCLMNLTGNLFQPDIKLDIALPNERDEVERMVRNYIGSDEEMDMQILYLLSIGKFYLANRQQNGDIQNSNMMTSVLSSTLSGQLNNLLRGFTNNQWNFETSVNTGTNGWTDMEIEGMLSGQMFNNRLLINGNFGYRENALTNATFVGDFDLQYLLTQSGNIILKVSNKTNDQYYTRTSLTTQGIDIVYRRDFNYWSELLRSFLFWKKKK